MLANAMLDLAAESGLTVPLGTDKLGKLIAFMEADEAVPKGARQAVRGLLDRRQALAESAQAFETEIVAHARHDDSARRLATIPGIGPITASLIVATVDDIGVFQSARYFAAWLGLVPRQHSTGGTHMPSMPTTFVRPGYSRSCECQASAARRATSRLVPWRPRLARPVRDACRARYECACGDAGARRPLAAT